MVTRQWWNASRQSVVKLEISSDFHTHWQIQDVKPSGRCGYLAMLCLLNWPSAVLLCSHIGSDALKGALLERKVAICTRGSADWRAAVDSCAEEEASVLAEEGRDLLAAYLGFLAGDGSSQLPPLELVCPGSSIVEEVRIELPTQHPTFQCSREGRTAVAV